MIQTLASSTAHFSTSLVHTSEKLFFSVIHDTSIITEWTAFQAVQVGSFDLFLSFDALPEFEGVCIEKVPNFTGLK
jgi:hypothetical protein